MTKNITEAELKPILENITEEPPLLDLAFQEAKSGLREIHRILGEKYIEGKEIFTRVEIDQTQNDIDEMAGLIMRIDAINSLFRKKL